MQKRIVYETLWLAKDKTKEYPHGWGFDSPLVEFPQDADPAWVIQMCMKFSNEEFECYGVMPKRLISFEFEYPKDSKQFEEWKKNNEYK